LIVEDISGNSKVASLEFTTGELPQITSFSPVGGAVEMSTHIGFGLSKEIRVIEILIEGVNGTTTVSGSHAVFEPEMFLSPQTEYEVIVTGYDKHDLPFGPFNWSFTTVGYARVIGKVVDQGDRALVGVEIHVDDERVTPTDYTGSFELFLFRGHHVINLSFDGYLNRSIEVDLTYGQLLDLEEIMLEKEETSTGPKIGGASSPSGIALIIAAVLISVVLVIVLLLIIKSKGATVSDRDSGGEGEDPTDHDHDNEIPMVGEERITNTEEDYFTEYGNGPME
jgi:hypothetical protein